MSESEERNLEASHTVRFTRTEKARLQAAAKTSGHSLSAYLRRLILRAEAGRADVPLDDEFGDVLEAARKVLDMGEGEFWPTIRKALKVSARLSGEVDRESLAGLLTGVEAAPTGRPAKKRSR